MSATQNSIRNIAQSWLPVVAALIVGFLCAGIERQPVAAQAQSRETPQRAAFQSGAARSETVLREIATTLKQIDARLQRIERVVAEGRPAPPAN